MKGAHEAASEYDGYRGQVMQLLRDDVPAQRIAEHLSEVEQTRMGLTTTPEQLLPLGQRLIEWYSHSLKRWEEPHSSG